MQLSSLSVSLLSKPNVLKIFHTVSVFPLFSNEKLDYKKSAYLEHEFKKHSESPFSYESIFNEWLNFSNLFLLFFGPEECKA